MWVDQGSEFYNAHFKKWLKDNNIEMYSIHNQGKSVVAERFIRTLKNKITVKNTVPWTYVISDLNNGQIISSLYGKELQKTSQKEFRIEKVIEKKGDKIYVKWEGYSDLFNSWIDQNEIDQNIKVELDLSSYATKTDLKNVAHVDVSNFASKTNLASLKTEVDKLDIVKLTPVPDKLVKLSNVVKNDVVKKTKYYKLVSEVENIGTTGFVLKTSYDTDKSDLEKKTTDTDKKISDTSDLAKKTNLNANITEIENKIPSITCLAANSAVTDVKNKILDVSSLVKKADYSTKISDIEK